MTYPSGWNKMSAKEAFETLIMPTACGCHLWLGRMLSPRREYGRFSHAASGIKDELAHRVAWQLYRGPLMDADCILHRCDVPACVNPDHLFVGDQLANIADRDAKGRQSRGEHRPSVRLTEEQVREIIASPHTARQLAATYGVSHHTVNDLRRTRRRKWKHLQ